MKAAFVIACFVFGFAYACAYLLLGPLSLAQAMVVAWLFMEIAVPRERTAEAVH
jgi:hypothetical protein